MKATTIKLEGELLEELEAVKPKSQSVSSYVREILRRDIREKHMRSAASAYQAFLKANPEEQSWLMEWDKADLVSNPRRKHK